MTKTPTRLRVDLCLSLLLTALAANMAAAQPAKRVSAKPIAPSPVCLVADFKVIGLENHEPQERLSKAMDWLKKNGTACTLEQAVAVSSNRASWMGNADSPALMGTLEAIIETKQKAAIAAATAAATAEAARKVSQATQVPAVAATPDAAPSASATPGAATTTSSSAGSTPANRTAAATPVAVPVVVPVVVPAAQVNRPTT